METCKLLPQGVAAIFGPQSQASADHIRSIVDSVEIPFIDTRWNYQPSARKMGQQQAEYSINLHPDVEALGMMSTQKCSEVDLLFLLMILGQAYVDLIERYDWDTITILYENNDSMARLKKIFDRTAEVNFVIGLKVEGLFISKSLYSHRKSTEILLGSLPKSSFIMKLKVTER